MSDLLTTSVSGLLAFQSALDVTSNNIANASTPGYDVETANLTSQPTELVQGGYIGTGVLLQSVSRSYNDLLAQQVNSSQAAYSSFNTLATQAAQVDNMLSASGTGLTATLQNFSNALQTLSTNPNSSAARQALLSQATALAQQIQSYSGQVSTYGSQVESQIGTNVNQINSIASNIALLNQKIAADQGNPQHQPNDLLDQRDKLVNQLSQYVTVNTAPQSDGTVNVYIGSGQALVTGDTAQPLVTIASPYQQSVADVGLKSDGNIADITSEMTGGSLGGLLATRAQVINPTQNALGQIALGLADVMNQQQESGLTQTGTQGKAMFAVGGPVAYPASSNTGNATLTVSVSSVAQVTTSDYELKDVGGTIQLVNSSSGSTVAMTGAGTVANPYQADGLSIVVNGTPAAGDSFLVQPTANAAAGLSVLMTDPTQIAAASALQSTATGTNTGTGTIGSPTVVNPANAQLFAPTTIQFLTPTTYEINGAGNFAYTPGSSITGNGWTVSISGTPAAGDTFTVASNTNATGDNANALAMIQGLSAPSLGNGSTSLSGAANGLVSQIGVLTQQAQSNASAQQTVNQDATTAFNNVSGVNLNEEAAKMLQYQQAFQACAQMIQSSNQMFTSLMTAISNR